MRTDPLQPVGRGRCLSGSLPDSGAQGGIAAAAIPLLAYWAKGSEIHWAEPALYLGAVWLMVTLVVAMFRRGPTGKPLAVVSVTLFGCLYASALLAFLIPIRHGANAANRPFAYLCLTLFPMVITWIGDTAAMVIVWRHWTRSAV